MTRLSRIVKKEFVAPLVLICVSWSIIDAAHSDEAVIHATVKSLVALSDQTNILGTGFIISVDNNNSSAIVVTSYHVMRWVSTLRIIHQLTDRSPKYDDLSILQIDPIKDIALIRINNFEGFDEQGAPLDISKSGLKLSDNYKYKNVFGVAYHAGSPRSLTDGRVSTIVSASYYFDERKKYGITDNYKIILHTADTEKGSSGGVLMLETGEIIGVLTGNVAENKMFGFAVPIEYVDQLLGSGILSSPISPQAMQWTEYETTNDPYYRDSYYEKSQVNVITRRIRLRNIRNDPIRNADVTIEGVTSSSESFLRFGRTDDNGYYSVVLPVRGDVRWNVEFKHKNYNTYTIENVTSVLAMKEENKLTRRSCDEEKVKKFLVSDKRKVGLNYNRESIEIKANELVNGYPIKTAIEYRIAGSTPAWLNVVSGGQTIKEGWATNEGIPLQFLYTGQKPEDGKNGRFADLLFLPKESDRGYATVTVYPHQKHDVVRIKGRLLGPDGFFPDESITLNPTIGDNSAVGTVMSDLAGGFYFEVDGKYGGKDKYIQLNLESYCYKLSNQNQSKIKAENTSSLTIQLEYK